MDDDFSTLAETPLKALQEAADGVVDEARRTNSVVVVWENGAVRRIPASELPPAKEKPSPQPCLKGRGD
jgi:hypothetical protein